MAPPYPGLVIWRSQALQADCVSMSALPYGMLPPTPKACTLRWDTTKALCSCGVGVVSHSRLITCPKVSWDLAHGSYSQRCISADLLSSGTKSPPYLTCPLSLPSHNNAGSSPLGPGSPLSQNMAVLSGRGGVHFLLFCE